MQAKPPAANKGLQALWDFYMASPANFLWGNDKLSGLVRTANEHTRDGADPIQAFPDRPHLRLLVSLWEAESQLAVAKSRQMMVSWLCVSMVLYEVFHPGKRWGIVCMDPSTRILTEDLRWVAASDLRQGDLLLGADEGNTKERPRCVVPSTVLASTRAVKPCFRVRFTDGTAVIVSSDHRMLARKRSKNVKQGKTLLWYRTSDIRVGMEVPDYFPPWEPEATWDAGWLAGFLDGEGTLTNSGVVVSQCSDNGLLDKAKAVLTERGFRTATWDVEAKNANPKGRPAETSSVLGGYSETLRLLGTVRPKRLLAKHAEYLRTKPTRLMGYRFKLVSAVEPVGPHEVVVLETSARTYFAEGMLQHNCKTFEGADSLLDRMWGIYQRIPDGLRPPAVRKQGLITVQHKGAPSQVHAFSQNSDEARSKTYSGIVIDEAAFTDTLDDLLTASKPTVMGGGKIVLVSTPNFLERFAEVLSDNGRIDL